MAKYPRKILLGLTEEQFTWVKSQASVAGKNSQEFVRDILFKESKSVESIHDLLIEIRSKISRDEQLEEIRNILVQIYSDMKKGNTYFKRESYLMFQLLARSVISIFIDDDNVEMTQEEKDLYVDKFKAIKKFVEKHKKIGEETFKED